MILDQLSHYTLQITKGKDEHEHEHDVGCSASINIITKPTPCNIPSLETTNN